jgi:phytoene synthase
MLMLSPDTVAADDQSPDHGYRADLAACRRLLRGGSRSFHAASLLLPRSVRDPATALYAFCRVADDAIDHSGGRQAALDRLRERLARAYEGRPLPIPADRALAVVLARFAIPAALPEALLDGFAWDAAGRRYETLTALTDYAVRVAGTVGAMMAMLMGVRAPALVARACELGVAMQLSNIARDVGEDAAAGRLYLPLAWLREAGIDPDAWLAAPVHSPALGTVVCRMLAHADTLYARADAGVRRLPLACRPGIGAARLLYAEIGREVARRGGDGVGSRAVVPTGRKLALLGRSVAEAVLPGRRPTAAGSLPEARYLIDAVAAAPPPPPPPPPAGGGVGRGGWGRDQFERLGQRQHVGSGQVGSGGA